MSIIKNNKWFSFKESLIQLHNPKKIEDLDKNSLMYERISFDEIFSNLLKFLKIVMKTSVFRLIDNKILLKRVYLYFFLSLFFMVNNGVT